MLTRVFPFLAWFKRYSLASFRTDLISGVTVALVLIPQSMAYAQLAGLPPHYGLYAAFLPPIVASLFGSSHQLATGPVAVVSLMTATALEPLATAGSAQYITYAILLALMVGVFQFALGLFRLGFVVNFLSHPVVNGFTNAAAIIIATSQLSKLFGVYVDKAEHHYETIFDVCKSALDYIHWPSLGMAILAIAIMVTLKKLNRKLPNVLVAVLITTLLLYFTGFNHDAVVGIDDLEAPEVTELIGEYNRAVAQKNRVEESRAQLTPRIREAETTHGEHSAEALQLRHELTLMNLAIGELKQNARNARAELRSFKFEGVTSEDRLALYLQGAVPPGVEGDGRTWRLKVSNRGLDEEALLAMGGGAVVATIPSGLPRLGMPEVDFGIMMSLISMAVIISLLGFMEAISIAKAMAVKTGQRLDPNQELIGQGLANVIGAVGRSYPCSGSFSRSAVNLQAGALTGLSNAFCSGVVVITLLFFTPLLFHLPQAVLASIIMMAVIGLVNATGFIHAWKAHKLDGSIAIITFASTLLFAPHLDRGIMIGVVLSLGVYIMRHMKPDIALLSKHEDGTFRASHRLGLEHCEHIAVIRFNASLFFANVQYLEDKVIQMISELPALKHVHLVGNAINEMDSSGEEKLSQLVTQVRGAGYDFSVSGLNESVLDVMKRTGLYAKIGKGRIFGNVASMVEAIFAIAHKESIETDCPLRSVRFEASEPEAEARRSLDQMLWGGKKAGKEENALLEHEEDKKAEAREEEKERPEENQQD